jgi:hypothetical protein
VAIGKTPCGIAIPQTSSPVDVQLIREFLARAEKLGYESVWVQEQIIGDSPILEPVTLLTYAAPLFYATTVLSRCLGQGHERVAGSSIKSRRCCRPCRVEGCQRWAGAGRVQVAFPTMQKARSL